MLTLMCVPEGAKGIGISPTYVWLLDSDKRGVRDRVKRELKSWKLFAYAFPKRFKARKWTHVRVNQKTEDSEK